MNEIIETEINNPDSERDALGLKKRRWGFNREQRAALRKAAVEAQSQVTDEHRLRLLWKENFDALDQQTQSDLRQRESHVLYLTGSMLLFLDQFAKHPNDVLSPVSEPCSTFDEVEEYLGKFPLVNYLPDCLTFSLIGIDLESQRVRSLIPCDGYRLYGLRVSLGGGSWPTDVLDGNGRSLYYRFMFGLDAYCSKHKSEVDPHVAKAARQFVESRIKPAVNPSTATARPVTAAPQAPTAILGWVEPVSSTVEREMQLSEKIRCDVRESIKKFQEDLQEKL